MSALFSPVRLREIGLRNRVVVAPMHQYAAVDGHVGDWTLMNAGRFAAGGAGLVIVESTKVERRGCGTLGDLGIWDDRFIGGLARLADFIRVCGAVPGIQLSHCGRKARRQRPWEGGGPLSGLVPDDPDWQPVAPSAIAQAPGWEVPQALSTQDIAPLISAWVHAARRADRAGFDVIEIQACHGYLLHQFLSAQSNRRDDAYGGSFENRIRLLTEILAGIRQVWPASKPVFVRISATDDASWTLEDSVALSRRLFDLGADVIDCSSGGIGPPRRDPAPAPGHKIPYARHIRAATGGMTMAVGMIHDPHLAEDVVAGGHADLVAVGRALLDNPQWPLAAARALGVGDPLALLAPAQSYWLRGWHGFA